MAEMQVRDILDDVPLYREKTIPLVLMPKIHVFVEIHSTNHLSNSTELTTGIHLIHGEDRERGVKLKHLHIQDSVQ